MPLHFIAIVTPASINQQVLEWKLYMQQQYGCKAALKSPAHITLIPPFNMPDEDSATLTSWLDQFATQQQPFPIELHNFNSFAPRVLFVAVQPSTQLQALQQQLKSELLQADQFNISKEDRPFHPHVTIANRDLKEEDFSAAWQHFEQLNYEAVFTANSIALLKHNGQVWEIANNSVFS